MLRIGLKKQQLNINANFLHKNIFKNNDDLKINDLKKNDN